MSEISRLRWLCRRGMKELDLVMTRYLENYYEKVSTEEQAEFRQLLELQDPDLYALILGRKSLTAVGLKLDTRLMQNLVLRN